MSQEPQTPKRPALSNETLQTPVTTVLQSSPVTPRSEDGLNSSPNCLTPAIKLEAPSPSTPASTLFGPSPFNYSELTEDSFAPKNVGATIPSLRHSRSESRLRASRDIRRKSIDISIRNVTPSFQSRETSTSSETSETPVKIESGSLVSISRVDASFLSTTDDNEPILEIPKLFQSIPEPLNGLEHLNNENEQLVKVESEDGLTDTTGIDPDIENSEYFDVLAQDLWERLQTPRLCCGTALTTGDRCRKTAKREDDKIMNNWKLLKSLDSHLEIQQALACIEELFQLIFCHLHKPYADKKFRRLTHWASSTSQDMSPPGLSEFIKWIHHVTRHDAAEITYLEKSADDKDLLSKMPMRGRFEFSNVITSGKPTKHLQKLPNWQHYWKHSPTKFKNHTDSEELFHQLIKPLTTREIGRGTVYMFQDQKAIGHIKIGHTKITSANRVKQWASKCEMEIVSVTAGIFEDIPHANRVENIIQVELRNERRIWVKCATCGSNHREWFEVNFQVALECAKKWIKWMEREPYELVPQENHTEARWRLKREMFSEVAEMVMMGRNVKAITNE